jgi:hypothetical protein
LKTAYLTDSFSTLGGLGSVAYGDPEYFREVQNQVYAQSPTRFADIQRPSDVFESLALSGDKFTRLVGEILEAEYAQDKEFTDYVDVAYGPGWRDSILVRFYNLFQQSLDSTSTYEVSLSDYVGRVVRTLLPSYQNAEQLTRDVITSLATDPFSPAGANLASKIISNNPQTKLSTPPSNAKIPLESSVDLGLDYRGVSFATGYSTLEDYWSDVPYPGVTSVNLIPATFRESILNGYVGYASETPLEVVYNPIGADSIRSFNLSSPEALNFSDPFGGGSVLAQLPVSLQGDADIYSISLIGETLNGYTTFDPGTMSNGDAIDLSLIPDFEGQNADPDGGLPGLSRTFASPF